MGSPLRPPPPQAKATAALREAVDNQALLADLRHLAAELQAEAAVLRDTENHHLKAEAKGVARAGGKLSRLIAQYEER